MPEKKRLGANTNKTNKKKPSASTNNHLHGITLEALLTQLVADYGWDELGGLIDIRCFTHDPSIKSSLKFLRKTPWARDRVEALYIRHLADVGSLTPAIE